jgi:predicted dehydrogenase
MPHRITGFCGLGVWHDIEVEDQVTAYLEYEDNCTGLFVASTGEAPGTNRFEIAGEKGKLVMEKGQVTLVRNEVPTRQFSLETTGMFTKPPAEDVPFQVEGHGGQHAEILENFADAILTGAELVAPAEEGIHSVELANAMLFSSLLASPVEIPMDSAAYEARLKQLIAESDFTKISTDSVAGDLSGSFN